MVASLPSGFVGPLFLGEYHIGLITTWFGSSNQREVMIGGTIKPMLPWNFLTSFRLKIDQRCSAPCHALFFSKFQWLLLALNKTLYIVWKLIPWIYVILLISILSWIVHPLVYLWQPSNEWERQRIFKLKKVKECNFLFYNGHLATWRINVNSNLTA